MSTTTQEARTTAHTESEYVTFYVGDVLLGVDITSIDEINRHVDVTPVPQAPPFVCGVLNLRGEVVTVVDLRMILGLPPGEAGQTSRTVMVRSKDEQIGLRVDRIGNVITSRAGDIDPVPPNLGGIDARFLNGVYRLEAELLLILDVDAALAA